MGLDKFCGWDESLVLNDGPSRRMLRKQANKKSMIKFGDFLYRLRYERNVPQNYVARFVKVVPSTIGMWEKGGTSPTFENLVRLAKFFKVPIKNFIAAGYIARNINSMPS